MQRQPLHKNTRQHSLERIPPVPSAESVRFVLCLSYLFIVLWCGRGTSARRHKFHFHYSQKFTTGLTFENLVNFSL